MSTRLDSWKGYSALESIIESPFSQLRKFILQMLLLQGIDGQSKEIIDLAMECKNLEVLGMILTWETTGREAGTSSTGLFRCVLAILTLTEYSWRCCSIVRYDSTRSWRLDRFESSNSSQFRFSHWLQTSTCSSLTSLSSIFRFFRFSCRTPNSSRFE